jgi:hypothetical protein
MASFSALSGRKRANEEFTALRVSVVQNKTGRTQQGGSRQQDQNPGTVVEFHFFE